MNSSYSHYDTYPAVKTSAFRRLSGSLSSNWISVREGRGGDKDRNREPEDIPVYQSAMEDAETKCVCPPDLITVSAADPAAETEAERKDAPAMHITAEAQNEEPAKTITGLSAYGCAYHKGSQRLAVSHPGDAAPVHFSMHSCLSHIYHNEGDACVEVAEAGDYEITFDVRVSAKTSAPVVFELRAGNEPVPGGTFVFTLSSGYRECRGGTMACLKAGDRIGLVMSSVSVCEASLTAGGVSAILCLKKLN